MTRKEELLASYDEAWSYKWESVESILAGITEEEAHFQHPVYSDVPKEPGHPPSGTILWHLVHLAHCYRNYTQAIRLRPEDGDEVPPPEAKTLDEAIANLKLFRSELRDNISALNENQLDEKIFNYKTVAQLARMTIRHDAWHSAQIALAKRLYKYRR